MTGVKAMRPPHLDPQAMVRQVLPTELVDPDLGASMELLQECYVSTSNSKRIPKSKYQELLSRQFTVSPTLDPVTVNETFGSALARRASYRGPVTPLTEDDTRRLIHLIAHSATYRPVGHPGALRVVSLIFYSSPDMTVYHMAEEDDALRPVEHSGLRDYLVESFCNRPEIPAGVPGFIAVGVDMKPLILKYGRRAVGLCLTTVGAVLELLELVSAHLNLRSVILYGASNHAVWSLDQRQLVAFPACLRVGRAQ